MTKRKNTYATIRIAMLRNEREVLAFIRRRRRVPSFLLGRQWNNALDRLVAKGRVHFVKRGFFGAYEIKK